MTDELHRVTPGMVLLEDKGQYAPTLWAVCGGAHERKNGTVTATLRSYSGHRYADEREDVPWASVEASVTFPGGVVRPPFSVVTVADIRR